MLFTFINLYLFATKKGGGSVKNGRDSNPKYLCVKLQDGQNAKIGCILVSQRGTIIHPGCHVGDGKDHTLFSMAFGVISFKKHAGKTVAHVFSN